MQVSLVIKRGGICVALALFFAVSLSAQEAQKGPLLVTDIRISGTTALDSNQINDIVGPLMQKRMADEDEIRERIRFRLQDRGYFDADVKPVKLTSSDPLANPKPVTAEVEVAEGPRYRIGEIRFVNNHVIGAEELRAQFPIKSGEIFERSKIGGGLDALRELYAKKGYINFTPIPITIKGASLNVDLKIDVDEGDQYRMGELTIAGDSNLAGRLRAQWKLEQGAPFDGTYMNRFLEENATLLPAAVNADNSVYGARNCRDKTVTLLLNLDPENPPKELPRDKPCENKAGEKKDPTGAKSSSSQ